MAKFYSTSTVIMRVQLADGSYYPFLPRAETEIADDQVSAEVIGLVNSGVLRRRKASVQVGVNSDTSNALHTPHVILPTVLPEVVKQPETVVETIEANEDVPVPIQILDDSEIQADADVENEKDQAEQPKRHTSFRKRR